MFVLQDLFDFDMAAFGNDNLSVFYPLGEYVDGSYVI